MKYVPKNVTLPLLVFGLLAYLVALVISFPAARAYAHWRASELASDQVALSGISGSVWSGRAALALVNGQPLENLEWSLRPWSVLFGEVGLGWRFQLPEAKGYAQGNAELGLDGSIGLDSLEARLPAAMVARLIRASALRPAGTINLNLHNVLWDGKTLRSAEGRIVWNGAGISLLKPITLGDQSLTLETTEEGMQGMLSDGGGPLSLDGLLTVDADGKFTFSGSLAARNAPELERALRSLGRPGPDGRISVKRSGTLASLGLS